MRKTRRGGEGTVQATNRAPAVVFGNRGAGETVELRETIRTGTLGEKLAALTDVHKKMDENAIGAETAIALLLKATSDENALVRRHAVAVLEADMRIMPGLLLCLKNENDDVRRLASAFINRNLIYHEGLWRTNNPADEEVNEACTVLMRALLDTEEKVRMEACGSLCQLADRSTANTVQRFEAFIREELGDLSRLDGMTIARLARIQFDTTEAMGQG